MPIARNKKNPPVDPDAIAAFGAAAELRPEPAGPPAPTPPTRQRATTPRTASADEEAPPASSIVRWAGEEELRDRIIAYRRAERYKMQDLMIKAMQIGLDQLEQR
jgi:hypothetical protein